MVGDPRTRRRADMRPEVTGRAGPPPSWSCSQALSPVVTEAAPASRPAAGASLLLRGVWPAWQVAVGPGPALGAGAESRGAGRQGGLCAGRDWGHWAWEGGAGLGARQTDGTRPSDGHWAPSPRLGVRPQVWGTSSVRPPSLPTPAANRGPPGTHTSDCPPSSALPLPVPPLLPGGACPACPPLALRPRFSRLHPWASLARWASLWFSAQTGWLRRGGGRWDGNVAPRGLGRGTGRILPRGRGRHPLRCSEPPSPQRGGAGGSPVPVTPCPGRRRPVPVQVRVGRDIRLFCGLPAAASGDLPPPSRRHTPSAFLTLASRPPSPAAGIRSLASLSQKLVSLPWN